MVRPMATTTARKPKKLTRADRENARKADVSANACLDLVRAGKMRWSSSWSRSWCSR
jgi:hypothetical protein